MKLEDSAQVKASLARLLASEGESRSAAAAELGRLGVWTRGSVRTRGSMVAAGKNRLPEPEKLKALIGCLGDPDRDVRREVTSALGEWGGEEAARAIAQILESGVDEELQLYCVGAVRTIGGPVAIEGLRYAMAHGSNAVRDAAISAISDLPTGGATDDTEDPLTAQPRALPDDRERGAVRTRGSSAGSAARRIVGRVVGTLNDVREDPSASEYVRLRADHVMGFLKK